MRKYHSHHALFVFMLGAVCGIFSFVLGLAIVSQTSTPALGYEVGAPSMGSTLPFGAPSGGITTSGPYGNLPFIPTYTAPPALNGPELKLLANGKDAPITVPSGSDVSLMWFVGQGYITSIPADTCTTSWDALFNATDNVHESIVKSITANTTYTVTCGSYTAKAVVNITLSDASPLIVTALVNDQSGEINLPWNTAQVKLSATTNDQSRIASCGVTHANQQNGGPGVPDPFQYTTYNTDFTYTVSCKDYAGNVAAQSSVKVHFLPNPNPPTPVQNNALPGESGPHDVGWVNELVIKIINPAPNAEIGPSGSNLIVRGYSGYIPLANGEKKYMPWDWMTMWLDGKQFASYNTAQSFYPCNETGGSVDAKYWCVSRAFDPMGVGNGTHELVAQGGTVLHGNTRDSINFVAKGIPVQNNTGNTGGGGSINTKSNIGTLNAASEGYMYITGRMNGYLGYKRRIINLYVGNYTIYVYGPRTGKLCTKKNFRIDGGKTSLIKFSGGCY